MSQKNQTRKKFERYQNDLIFTKISELCQNDYIFAKKISSAKTFQYSQIVYIKSITQLKSILFLFSHLLTCKNSTIF